MNKPSMTEVDEMPWDMNDYPDSFKNLDKPVKKKAIDIANAMIDDGYDEGRAIPIATEQAKEWHDNADQDEIDSFMENGDPTSRSEEDQERDSRPELLEKAEHVKKHEDGWAVVAEDAKQPSDVYDNKDDAVERAKEIARNKGTEAVIHKTDGSIQDRVSYKNS